MATVGHLRTEEALLQIREHGGAIRGCSDSQLQGFQQERGLELPSAYLRFLAVAGLDPGDFLVGSDLRFEQLDDLQSGARYILEDDKGPALPDDAFVFCSHQGYQFLFFRLSQGPDPQVFWYLEESHEFKLVASSFSEWLGQTVRELWDDSDGRT